MSASRPWWHPDRHTDRRPALMARNRIQAALREWFGTQDFVEVDPSALVISPGNEVHLHGFATIQHDGQGGQRQMYLHTSPEFAMKKLLAAGEPRLHAFSHVWRNHESGPRHSAEFTMLEWYRAHEDYTALFGDCAQILRLAAQAAGVTELRHGAHCCDPFAAPERLGVVEAFSRYAGIDLRASLRDDGTTDREALAVQMAGAGLRVADDDDWSALFARVLVARVEPHLGHGRATILDRYPLAEAALARPVPDAPYLAERFELYACGVELANGFGELTDPREQRRRFEADMQARQEIYGERYPLDEDFLAALAFMPPASGIALGFDRLVMLATAAPQLDAVIWAPVAPWR